MNSINSGEGGVATPLADEIPYPFECQFCETLYKSLDAYTSHLEVHETVFQYEHSCTLCAQKFVCKQELQLHSRLHSDLKPYKCKLCSQSFRLARNLEYHLIGHGGKRVFSCSLCSVTFLQLADMHEHLRDHQMGRIVAKSAPPAEGLQDKSPANGGGVVPGDEKTEDKYIPPVQATYPEQPPTEAAEEEKEEEEEEDLHTNAYSVGSGGVVGGEQRRSRQTVVAADGAAGAASHVKLESAASTYGGVVVLVGGGEGAVNATAVAAGDENAEYDEEALFARAVNVKKTFCNLCNKKMATRKSLNTHYKSVHMKNAHTCSVCRTSFLFSRLLEEHTRRRKRIIPCEFCDQRFCSNKRWDSHITKHRSDSLIGGGGGSMVMYPRAVPLSITMGRQVNQQSQQPQQQQTVTSTTTTSAIGQSKQPLSLLKNNLNHNNSSSSSSSSPSSSMSGGGNNAKANRTSLLLANVSAQPTITLVNLTEGTNTIGKFPCDSCGKIFLSLHYLQSHLVKRRNPNFQFQCDVCEHRFSKKAILDEHKDFHSRMVAKKGSKGAVVDKQLHSNGSTGSNKRNSSTANSGNGKGGDSHSQEEEMDFDRHIIRLPDSSFKCNCCHRTFKAINHLKCHLRYTHMKKSFKCRSCNQQFPYYKLYLAHMKNSKLCERCDKRICAKFDFKIHTQKCRGTAKMRNSTGNMALPKSNIVEIKDDEEEDQEPEEQALDGEEDDAVIIDENGGAHLQMHSSLLLPSLLDAAAAATATDEYPSIPDFLMDDLLVEPEEYKCDPCGKVFSKMTSLHMHSFQHDPNKEMKCLFCNFLFLQRSSLNRHYRCRNSLHTCQVCKEAFCSHLNLRQHSCGDGGTDRSYVDSSTVVAGGDDEYMDVSDLKSASSGGESRKRNRAGNVISSAAARLSVGVNSEDVSGRDESIELSDTEPDSLACMMCPLVLNTKAELDHHVATEHGTVTKCSICRKSFRSPTILHIHMAARASKKNKIECPSCPHRFNKQAEFRKHFMYHTMKQNRPETSDEAIYSRIASKYFGK